MKAFRENAFCCAKRSTYDERYEGGCRILSKSIKEISKSMSNLSKGLCSSMELLAKSLGSQNLPPQHLPHQNIYYQQYQQQPPNPQFDNGLSLSQQTGFYSQYLNDGEQF